MSNAKKIAAHLRDEKSIDENTFDSIVNYEDNKLFSVKRQLIVLLYSGVTLLTAGLGILIYENIDSIGHNIIVITIGLLTAICFGYCAWQREEFEWHKIEPPNLWFDYILLLGSLLLVTLIGYLQFEFDAFGERWGLATFIPFAILAFAAYFFDHLGVLSMSIVLFASWLGIAVTPQELFLKNDFSNERFIFTGIGLSVFLYLVSYASEKYKLKSHFAFTYFNFAMHVGFVAALSGLFFLSADWLYDIVVAAMIYFCFRYALNKKSFYVMLCLFLYGYIALSYNVIHWVSKFMEYGMSSTYTLLIYFILSAVMLIKYLRDLKHKLHDDSIQ